MLKMMKIILMHFVILTFYLVYFVFCAKSMELVLDVSNTTQYSKTRQRYLHIGLYFSSYTFSAFLALFLIFESLQSSTVSACARVSFFCCDANKCLPCLGIRIFFFALICSQVDRKYHDDYECPNEIIFVCVR